MQIISLIFISCMTQFCNCGIIAIAVSKLESLDATGALSSSVSISNAVGISFAGLSLGSLLQKWQGFKLGVLSPIISASLILPLILFEEYHLTLLIIFLISIISGLENPNNHSTLNKLIINPKQKAHTFTMYATAAQISAVLSPLLAAILIMESGHKISYLFFMLFYVLICLPWILLNDVRFEKGNSKSNFFSGYKIIKKNKPLRDLIISRVLNNFLFSGVIMLIPIMVAKVTSTNDQFTIINNITVSSISLGFVFNGLISTKVLKNKPLYTIPFAKSATIIGLIAATVPVIFNYSQYSMSFMAFFLGFAQFYFRISGMTLGQAVTPANNLAEVILAGDTLVRGITAIYTITLLSLVKYYDSMIPLCFFCAISLLAPLFLSSSSKIYRKKCHA